VHDNAEHCHSQPDGTVDFCIYSFCRHGLLSAHTKGSSGVRACGQGEKQKKITGYILVLCVLCMTMIFAALDNAVTLQHAKGSLDVGQWPRLLLAVSGILAGFLLI